MANSLRIIIVVAAIVTVCTALTEEQKMKALEHADKCIVEIGVNREAVLKVMRGDFAVTDPNIECFAKCFFEKSGFMNSEGEFLEEIVIEKLSMGVERVKVETLVNTCKLQIGANACETAYKLYQCYYRHKAI